MKKVFTVLLTVFLILPTLILSGCGGSASTNTFDITVGDYTFKIPDHYNSEPSSSNEDSVLIVDNETGTSGFLSVALVDQTGSFTRYYKDAMLENGINSMHLDDVQTTGDDALSFTGTLSGVTMEGKIDMLYSAKADKAAIVFVMHQPDTDYDFCQDLDGIVASASVDGETGSYSEPISGSYNAGGSTSTDSDYAPGSDWEKYDSDKDGKINDQEFQDATGDYIDEYFDENGTGGDLNAYDYNGNGEMEDKEFQDAVNDYMDENGY